MKGMFRISEIFKQSQESDFKIYCELTQSEMGVLKNFVHFGIMTTDSKHTVREIFNFLGVANFEMAKISMQPKIIFQKSFQFTKPKHQSEKRVDSDRNNSNSHEEKSKEKKKLTLIDTDIDSTQEIPEAIDWFSDDNELFSDDSSDLDNTYVQCTSHVSSIEGENSDSDYIIIMKGTVNSGKKHKSLTPRLKPAKRIKHSSNKENTFTSDKSHQDPELYQKLKKEKPKHSYPCLLCIQILSSYSALQSHYKEYHPEPLNCKFCGEKCQSGTIFRIHARKLHHDEIEKVPSEEMIYKCHFCNATFSTKGKMDFHDAYVHSGLLRFHCKPCKLQFMTKPELKKHNLLYHNEEGLVHEHDVLECRHCKLTFEDLILFRAHVTNCHLPKTEWPFECHYCSDRFLSKSALHDHTLVCESQFKLVCDKCDMKFEKNSLLLEHLKDFHGVDPFKNYCIICSKGFVIKSNLEQHYNAIHKDGFKTCAICQVSFADEQRLKFHEEYFHSDPNIFQCSMCGKKKDTPAELQSHVANDHKKKDLHKMFDRHRCKGCNVIVKRGGTLNFHIRKCHIKYEDWPIYCSTCDKRFVCESEKTFHHCQVSSKKRRPIPCHYCGKFLNREDGLQKHIQRMHEQEEFAQCCQICKMRFPNEQNLKHHMRHHWTSVCDYCGLIFPKPIFLSLHVQLKHSDSNPFQCWQCTFSVGSREQLLDHLQKDHDSQFLKRRAIIEKCESCDLKGSIYSLSIHISAYHMRKNDKRHMCEVCGKSCDTHQLLLFHKLMHQEKCLTCSYCNKQFRRQQELDRKQLNTHTKERSYRCDFCPKVFYMRESLYIHRKRTHSAKSMKS